MKKFSCHPHPLFLSGWMECETKIKSNIYTLHNLDTPLFLKGAVNFIYLPRSGDSEKFKNGSMVEGQVFSKLSSFEVF